MARILLIEDDEAFAAELASAIQARVTPVDIIFALGADDAVEKLKAGSFDLIVCDLRMPRASDNASKDNEGEYVLRHILSNEIEVPTVFLSGYITLDFMQKLVNQHARKVDAFGDGTPIAIFSCHAKERSNDAVAVIQNWVEKINGLSAIEVSDSTGPITLEPLEKRIIRIFARRLSGATVRVQRLSGGFSGASSLKVWVNDSFGNPRALAFSKIDRIGRLRKELQAYNEYVAPLGAIAFYAPRTGIVDAGAFDSGGVFYTVAEGYDRSIFDVLAESDDLATEVVSQLQLFHENWQGAAHAETTTVRSLRKAFATNRTRDKSLLESGFLDAVEALNISVRTCPQHRDHHGLNVLVNAANLPLLIDYSDVGLAPSCTDALTLEFSLFLHPAGKHIANKWPSADHLRAWWRLDDYIEGCPVPSFVRACRSWAFSVCEGEQMLMATAYALAIRALRFDSTDRVLANALAEASATRLIELSR